ncbi:NADPH-dependent 1-acyldihydroxyacetone phosphate reductase-like [Panicum miliaceum]|uniref:NADPH-dependent 1-acyldihydroxyacetone phosphate reductase-like n=1 Tax=Panicum miliaceum TaxID=4540 RepID=A0A3L6RBC9_PANMI|nr:NADPH-dependent 1-acyldihydroxyacetone phosphate reductase-like [Panicum miliaceum]
MANDGAGASSEVAGDGEAEQQQQPVVLITGCANGGIGYEYCLAFSALGCRVVATDIPDRVPDLADLVDLAAAMDTLPLDVTSESSVESAVRRVLADHGRIDVLVNNAGVGQVNSVPAAIARSTAASGHKQNARVSLRSSD